MPKEMSGTMTTCIAVVLFGLAAGLLFYAVQAKEKGRDYVEEEIRDLGYVPVVPPTRLTMPGTVVEVRQADPLILRTVCTDDTVLGPRAEEVRRSSPSSETKFTRKYTATLEQAFPALLGWQGQVKAVAITLTNVCVIEIADTSIDSDVVTSGCKEDILRRRAARRNLTVIDSVIIADVAYSLEYADGLSVDVREQIVREAAFSAGLAVGDATSTVIEGEALIWGVKEDPLLLDKIAYVPPPAGGWGERRVLEEASSIRVVAGAGHVEYQVQAIRQPTDMSCWAAVYAMMLGWREQEAQVRENSSVRDCLRGVGDKWVSLFDEDNGLGVEDQAEFVSESGLGQMGPQGFAMEGWKALLSKHGPLWVTTGDGFSAHAQLVIGVGGDYLDGYVEFVDPASGEVHVVPALEWLGRFEEEARYITGQSLDAELRMQVIHWR